MGRRKGSKNRKTLEKMGLSPAMELPIVRVDNRTDNEVLVQTKQRFEIFRTLIDETMGGSIKSLIASSSAGLGKSYTVEDALEQRRKKIVTGRFKILKGGNVSAIGLYEQAYAMRNPGDVIILDDSDSIFDDEGALNILKALLDTSLVRRVTWYTDHPRFKGDDAIPQEFIYEGAMIFCTNLNFQQYIDHGIGRYVPHMVALMSRSIYLDLKMHTRREVAMWARYIVQTFHILQSIGLSKADEVMLTDWIVENKDNLRELSIRTVLKLGQIYGAMSHKKIPWQATAGALLLREEK